MKAIKTAESYSLILTTDMVNEAISILIKLRVWKIFKEFREVRSQPHNKLRDFVFINSIH